MKGCLPHADTRQECPGITRDTCWRESCPTPQDEPYHTVYLSVVYRISGFYAHNIAKCAFSFVIICHFGKLLVLLCPIMDIYANVFDKPYEQRPTDRAARGEPSLLELSRVVTEEGGSQACLGLCHGEKTSVFIYTNMQSIAYATNVLA